MRSLRFQLLALVAMLAVAAMAPGSVDGYLQNASHTHIGHVGDGWRDTPDGVGLLPAAVAEAEIAARHAGLAAGASDVSAIKAHIGHVMNALDPSVEGSGPGKDYGVVKGAEGAARHITLAAEAEGASDNVKRHAEHIRTSAQNAVNWSRRALELGQEARASDDAAAVARIAAEIQEITGAILEGTDANGDGRVGWQEGEGGLAQATTHLGLMKRGEGLSR